MLPDPALYVETGGGRAVVCGALDLPRIRELGLFDPLTTFEELGFDALLSAGRTRREALAEGVVRACGEFGVDAAIMPLDSEANVVDALRNGGVAVTLEEREFELRRRRKTPAEVAGVERAQQAAQEALAVVREALIGGAPQTSESLRELIMLSLAKRGAVPHEMTVVAAGPESADPLCSGSGSVGKGVPIVIDIFPRDLASGCWGDLTRTVCLGEPPKELVEWHHDLLAVHQMVIETIRPGVSGHDLNRLACEYLAEQGHATRLSLPPESLLEDGVLHYLGHGVGLELLEEPTLDEGGAELIPGDVITVEPGIYRSGFGGCRIEDLVLVTENGYRNLTDCPYELEL